MGTISDKLVYLDGTREQIKENLNKFGSNITENDTFRSYSNVINDIYDKLPKVSANGSDFSLENAQNGKLDSFGMDGNTEQTTYSGKNLFNVGAVTSVSNGTLSSDGVITSTSGASENFNVAPIFPQQTLYSGKTYYLSADIRRVSGEGDFGKINDYVGDWQMVTAPTITNEFQRYVYKLTFNVDRSYYRILFQFRNTNNGVFEIKNIQISEVDSVYEPYCGGTPSPNPDYPQDIRVVTGNNTIKVTGKNLFDKSTITNGKRIGPQGEPYTDTNYSLSDYIKVQPNKIYTRNLTASVYQCIAYYTKDKLFINRNTSDATITTPNNAYYVRFSMENANVDTTQFEENSTATTYEPYQNQDYEIDLGDIELCKIGDYKDVIFKNNQLSEYYDSTLDEDSWYIKKEIGKVVLDGSEDWSLNQYNYFQTFVSNSTSDSSKRNGYCSHFKYEYNTGNNKIFFMVDNYVRIKYTDYSDKDTFKTWLSTHNTIVYYALVTPTYETITDETLISQLESIETFTGLNYFSVSNDNNVLPTLYVSRLKELGKLE